jgi:4-amino-4-deoxy-L-arabinose transferase-like glycosyltransferase
MRRWLGAAAAVAVAAGLGLYHLGSRSLWGDEAFSVTLARKPFGEFWHVVATSQANMSLYYVLLRGWLELGDGETVVRALSLLAGVAAVAVLYAAAERLFDRRIATLAALLLAVNAFFLRYAQEARSYALVLLLTTVATLLFLRLEERGGLGVAYVVVGALALYAHFFAGFVLVGHLLALAIAGRPLRAQLLRLAAIGVLAVPLALFALFRDEGQVSHLVRPTPTYVVDTLRDLAGGTRLLLLLYVVAVVVAGAGLLRRRDWPLVVAATWAATPVVGALVVSIGKPLFAPRFLIVALPGIVLLVAVGLTRVPLPATAAAFGLLLALSSVQVARTLGHPQEDFRAATAFVLANARSGDAIAFYRTSRRIPFEYYAGRVGGGALPRSLLPTSPYGRFDLVADYRHTNVTRPELAAIATAASRGRVWLLLSRSEDERVRAKQENRARLVSTVERRADLRRRRLFAGLDVRLYEPSSEAAALASNAASAAVECGGDPPSRAPRPRPVPRLNRVAILVLENKGCEEVIGSPEAPYLNGLAAKYSFASNHYALQRPSLPNYLGLTSGSTFGLAENCTDCSFRGRNIVDQLERAHISWKAYLESLPAPCFRGPSAPNQYVKEHNPFMYYMNVASNPQRCRRVVPLDRLSKDMASKALPRFVWISPNNCHNSHNCSIGEADLFVSRLVPRLLRALGPRGVLFLTYDEGSTREGCCGRAAGGRVATVVAGPAARRGVVSALEYDHYSILRTIEDAWRLPRLRGAKCPCTRSLSALLR